MGAIMGRTHLAPELFETIDWRCIGPHRGGRVVAVAGDPSHAQTFYFGACAGGVWKTNDGGTYWENVSDGYFGTAAVGAIAVSEADPNVIYAGTGEACIRLDVSHGDGVYRSTDGGATWSNVGLADSRHIGRIRIHPEDPDLVYVAALGHAFGPNEQRGVFRSRDGGANWERVLHRNAETGAIDLCIDPTNPRVLYAALWQVIRRPWILESGGPGSGIFKSTDGGDTWTEISGNPGLPEGIKGRIGIACSPAKSGRVWAIVEAEKGALLRSEDGGANWEVASAERDLRQRPWYYHHVFADPQDADTVWVLNLQAWKSTDAGKTFTGVSTPHGDNHDLWIDPADPRRMIEGNDGGACVSFNGGDTWSTIYNQPTSQFYHVTTDTRFPYRVYGTQQDNSAISVPSHSDKGIIHMSDCYTVGSSESGHIQVRPDNPDIVYSGAIGSAPGGGGVLLRYDHATAQIRIITAWPEEFSGYGPKDLKYRFQWTYPILISPHDPDVLYIAGNVLFRSTDDGASWEVISPDLTRDDKSKQEPSGGPITKDTTGAEHYCTIFAFVESPHRQGLFWAGSDDGLMHLSRDGRRHLAGDHAARPARMGDRGHHRAVPARPGDRLRGRLPLQARRLPPVPVQDRRLRRDLDADHRQPARRRLHAGHTRGSRASGSAVRRHRARPVCLRRRRRVLAAVQPQPAGRPHPRPGDPRRRPDRRHPRQVVLDQRRPGAGAAVGGRRGRPGAPVRACPHPAHGG